MVDGGLLILQYADDTILFMDHDLDKARNMKLLLFAFEQAAGLKINFHKSRARRNSLGAKRETFQSTTLASQSILENSVAGVWAKVEERFERRRAGGRENISQSEVADFDQFGA
ncbi:hypothetical protein U9M48_025389 [Paspalum notatum var. saurae]|uniref:Reverse transcriptase domain-containing protein n=1 Tax=Paspalum notatum var. saurae TaxID=547442 RepID=A0AAQ3WY89_PASNO